MLTGSVSALLDAMRQHHLLEPSHLEELGRGPVPADPRALAGELIRRGWLTAFQANLILQGRTSELLLGSYVLMERIGEGGMGQVYKARNWKLGRLVAIKLIRKERLANEDAVRRFHREIRAMAQLTHPNIVLAYDADEVNGTHFFVMEYVEGQDLAQIVKQRGPLLIADACDYIRQTALGLQHAHERGLVHRDIKPHNLLLTTQGVVKILDLGLAQLGVEVEDDQTSTLTQQGMVMGTLDYIAPEQAVDSHAVDIRADLYSLGCTGYHLLTGCAPFPGGKPLDKLYRHRHEQPAPLQQFRPQVPGGVAAIIRKLMAKQPEHRFQSPAELAAALVPDLIHGAPEAIVQGVAVPADQGIAGTTRSFGEKPSELTDLDFRDIGRDAESLRQKRQKQEWIHLVRLTALCLLPILAVTLLLSLIVAYQAEPKEKTTQKKEPSPEPDRLEVRKARVVLPGHTAAVTALVYTPQGGPLISGSQDQTIKVWDEPTKRFTMTTDHRGPVKALAISPDGKNLVSVGDGQTLHAWNAATLEKRFGIVAEYPRTVHGVAFTLRTSDQVIVIGDKQNMQQWSLSQNNMVGFRWLPAQGWSVACAADGNRFAFGLEDGGVHLTQHSEKEGQTWPGHRGPVKALAYSPVGFLIASGGADGLIKLWNTVTHEVRNELTGHKGEINGVAFSPDGKLLASASADGTVRLWGVVRGKEKAILYGHPKGVGAVAFSTDGKTLATGEFDGAVRLWDVPFLDGLD